MIWRGPETGDQLKQKEILESFITQRVDGIAISCLNGDFLTEAINRAVDVGHSRSSRGTPTRPTPSGIAFYGVDDKAGGRIMGEEAVKLLGGKGTVALMTSVGATNLQRRLDGVTEVLAKHPDIKIVETFDVKEDTVKAAEIIATGTNRYPDLGAWISVGGWPVFTRNALVPVPKSTHVISFDTIQPAPQLLKEGRVQILIGQKYFGWGSEPVKMLAENQGRDGCRREGHRFRRRRRPRRTTSMPTSKRSRSWRKGSRPAISRATRTAGRSRPTAS